MQQLPKYVFYQLRNALAENGTELTNDQLEMKLIDFFGAFELIDLDERDAPTDPKWFDKALQFIKNRCRATMED